MKTYSETNREKVEAALRVLDGMGFDTKDLWRTLSARQDDHERGTPTEADRKYELPTVAPTIAEHFPCGTDGLPEELSVSHMWAGYSYTLTKGQRALLRDTYGLTPTQTVTVSWVENWPGTRHPRAMRLVADLHVDPRNRKHVLVSAVIRGVGEFFTAATALDSMDTDKSKHELVDDQLEVGKVLVLDSVDRWAIEDLVGVKVESKVEVTNVSADRFAVLCLRTGRAAKLPRKEYFELVTEYAKLHEVPRAKRQRVVPAVDVTAELAKLAEQLGM